MTASFAWSFEVNVLALAVAGTVVIAGWALVNVLRGRHWRSLPDRVGPVEVAAFLLIPAVPPLIVGFQVSDAVYVVIESALFLAAVYVRHPSASLARCAGRLGGRERRSAALAGC